MIEDKIKLDAKKCTIVAGTTGNTIVEVLYSPDSSYDEIIGVEAYQNSDGGVTNGYYQIGISDEDKAYVEKSHKNVLLTSNTVDQRGKTRAVNIPIRKGNDLKIRFFWPSAGALASDLEVEMVFVLRRKVSPSI